MRYKQLTPGRSALACLSLATALAVIASGSVQAAARPKPGAACTKANAKARTAKGTALVCKRVGRREAWRLAPAKTGTTSGASPASTLTPSCVSLLVRINASMANQSPGAAPGSDSAGGLAAAISSMAACLKDTGNTAFITAPPFNLQDVASMTKFRSCAGHDFAEGSVDGQVVSSDPSFEKFSSMKHYVLPVNDAAGDQTQVFAPFDGVVTLVEADTGKTSSGSSYGDPGSQIHLVPYANPAYTFTFMHIYGISVKAGDSVKAGQELGYHEVQPANTGHSSFDVAMSKFDLAAMQAHVTRLVSFMTVLSHSVAGTFQNAGLTPDSTIWPRAYRESHPCQVGPNGFFVGPQSPDDSVAVQH